MINEYLEYLTNKIRYKKEHIRDDTYRLYIKENDIEFLEKALQRLVAIDNANPSEALERLERIDNTLCLNNIKGKLEFGIDTEEHTDCDSVIGMTEDLDTIKQSLLKAQELEKENAGCVGGRSFNKDVIYLKQSIEQCNDKPIFYISRSYGNKYIVPEKYFNNLTTERDTYKRILNIIKEKRVDIELIKKSDSWLDYYTRYKCRTGYNTEIDDEEFDSLKEWLSNE